MLETFTELLLPQQGIDGQYFEDMVDTAFFFPDPKDKQHRERIRDLPMKVASKFVNTWVDAEAGLPTEFDAETAKLLGKTGEMTGKMLGGELRGVIAKIEKTSGTAASNALKGSLQEAVQQFQHDVKKSKMQKFGELMAPYAPKGVAGEVNANGEGGMNTKDDELVPNGYSEEVPDSELNSRYTLLKASFEKLKEIPQNSLLYGREIDRIGRTIDSYVKLLQINNPAEFPE